MPTKNSRDPRLTKGLNRAIELNRAGRRQDAAAVLVPLLKLFPRSAAVCGYLGGVYMELNDFANAVRYFGKATRLSPRSELASLGLFHSLWDTGSPAAAFAEMRRFLASADSPAYAELLKDMAIEGRLMPKLEPVTA